jgi:hypothetical protein
MTTHNNCTILDDPQSCVAGICEDSTIISSIARYFRHNGEKRWASFPAGMGCLFIARHNGTIQNQPIWRFFMHSDSWGQYGAESSDIPRLVRFVPDDYTCGADDAELESFINDERTKMAAADKAPVILEKFIKCPTCRVESRFDERDPIVRFQLPEGHQAPKCIVCQDQEVNIILKSCGHCTLCKSCALRM